MFISDSFFNIGLSDRLTKPNIMSEMIFISLSIPTTSVWLWLPSPANWPSLTQSISMFQEGTDLLIYERTQLQLRTARARPHLYRTSVHSCGLVHAIAPMSATRTAVSFLSRGSLARSGLNASAWISIRPSQFCSLDFGELNSGLNSVIFTEFTYKGLRLRPACFSLVSGGKLRLRNVTGMPRLSHSSGRLSFIALKDYHLAGYVTINYLHEAPPNRY